MKKIITTIFLSLIMILLISTSKDVKVSAYQIYWYDYLPLPYNAELGGYGSIAGFVDNTDENGVRTIYKYYKMPYLVNATVEFLSGHKYLTAGSSFVDTASYGITESNNYSYTIGKEYKQEYGMDISFDFAFDIFTLGASQSYNFSETDKFESTKTHYIERTTAYERGVNIQVLTTGRYRYQKRADFNVYMIQYLREHIANETYSIIGYDMVLSIVQVGSEMDMLTKLTLGPPYSYDDYRLPNVVYF